LERDRAEEWAVSPVAADRQSYDAILKLRHPEVGGSDVAHVPPS
jgi:hypothetical protein